MHIIIYLSKPIECTAPGVNPSVSDGFWVITMCECRYIDCNKYTTLVQDADIGVGCAFGGAESKGNSAFQYFPVNFAVNLKLL